jgi:SAM-dependent methyltransferase
MTSSRTVDFAAVAPRYDELRPVDDAWWEVFDALVREGDLRGRRVLEVGCGTGKVAAALAERELCRVWGVDTSPDMLALASAAAPAVRFKHAAAERLPFRDGWFERVVLRMSVHLLDRPAALPELRRILAPGGRVAIATPDPREFERHWMNAYFPSVAVVDGRRFPVAERLEDELAAAGFARARTLRLSQERTITRDDALARAHGRAYSTFQLIPPEEYAAGLERARAELPELVEYGHVWQIVVAEKP